MLEWGNSGASESGGIEFWWSIYFIFLVRQAQTRASPLPPPFRVLAAAVDKLNPSPLFCSFFLIISILYPYPCCTGSSRQSVRRYGRFSSPQVIGYTPHARSPTLIEPGEASADYTYCIQVFPSGKASTVSYRTIIHSTRVKHHVIGSHTVRTRGERRAHGKEEAPRAIRTAAVWICCYHKRAAAVAYPTKTHYHLCLISHWHEPETVSFQSQSR